MIVKSIQLLKGRGPTRICEFGSAAVGMKVPSSTANLELNRETWHLVTATLLGRRFGPFRATYEYLYLKAEVAKMAMVIVQCLLKVRLCYSVI